jgi:RNA polymerase sigma factor (sigma-70 family)
MLLGPEPLVLAERERLVRLCARLTGDPDQAEDLAQETLLIAQRAQGQLRQARRPSSWLAGVARHLCLDWIRRRARERTRLGHSGTDPHVCQDAGAAQASETAGGCQVELELERAELAQLLDRAMALLPPQTRRVMIERLIEETPQAEVALRLGLSEGAVEARIQRGKLAMRRILTTELREEAAAYGLVDGAGGGWQTTRIWCTVCGQRRLVGRFLQPGSRLQLDCVDCPGVPGGLRRARVHHVDGTRPVPSQGVQGFKPALNRHIAQIHPALGPGIAGRTTRCLACGTRMPLQVVWSAPERFHYSLGFCPRCGATCGSTATPALALARPEGREFWRRHPRLRSLPEQVVEAGGRQAIVTRLESVTETASLTVLFTRDTLETLAVHRTPASGETDPSLRSAPALSAAKG